MIMEDSGWNLDAFEGRSSLASTPELLIVEQDEDNNGGYNYQADEVSNSFQNATKFNMEPVSTNQQSSDLYNIYLTPPYCQSPEACSGSGAEPTWMSDEDESSLRLPDLIASGQSELDQQHPVFKAPNPKPNFIPPQKSDQDLHLRSYSDPSSFLMSDDGKSTLQFNSKLKDKSGFSQMAGISDHRNLTPFLSKQKISTEDFPPKQSSLALATPKLTWSSSSLSPSPIWMSDEEDSIIQLPGKDWNSKLSYQFESNWTPTVNKQQTRARNMSPIQTYFNEATPTRISNDEKPIVILENKNSNMKLSNQTKSNRTPNVSTAQASANDLSPTNNTGATEPNQLSTGMSDNNLKADVTVKLEPDIEYESTEEPGSKLGVQTEPDQTYQPVSAFSILRKRENKSAHLMQHNQESTKVILSLRNLPKFDEFIKNIFQEQNEEIEEGSSSMTESEQSHLSELASNVFSKSKQMPPLKMIPKKLRKKSSLENHTKSDVIKKSMLSSKKNVSSKYNRSNEKSSEPSNLLQQQMPLLIPNKPLPSNVIINESTSLSQSHRENDQLHAQSYGVEMIKRIAGLSQNGGTPSNIQNILSSASEFDSSSNLSGHESPNQFLENLSYLNRMVITKAIQSCSSGPADLSTTAIILSNYQGKIFNPETDASLKEHFEKSLRQQLNQPQNLCTNSNMQNPKSDFYGNNLSMQSSSTSSTRDGCFSPSQQKPNKYNDYIQKKGQNLKSTNYCSDIPSLEPISKESSYNHWYNHCTESDQPDFGNSSSPNIFPEPISSHQEGLISNCKSTINNLPPLKPICKFNALSQSYEDQSLLQQEQYSNDDCSNSERNNSRLSENSSEGLKSSRLSVGSFSYDSSSSTHDGESQTSRGKRRRNTDNLPIPDNFTLDEVVNSPIDVFNQLIEDRNCKDDKDVMAMLRYTRRKAKNRLAAQKSRTKRMSNIDQLRLQMEKMKKDLQDLDKIELKVLEERDFLLGLLHKVIAENQNCKNPDSEI